MNLNDFVGIAQQVAPGQAHEQPVVDRTEQVNVGMEFAKRQSEKTQVEAPKIPTMGTTPVAN